MPAAAKKPKSLPVIQFRTAVFERAEVDEDKREITVSLSSENPVRMHGVEEILDHKDSSVRLGRLRASGVFLWNHSRDAVIGRIMAVKLNGNRLTGTVRFAKNSLAEEKWRDVQDGILRETSIGYRVYDAKLERATPEMDTYRVTDWEPFEGSLVSIPADASVGVGRSYQDRQTDPEIIQLRGNTMPEDITTPTAPAPAPQPAPAATRQPDNVISIADAQRQADTATSAEKTRTKEILTIADRLKDRFPGIVEKARSFIADGKSVPDFQNSILLEDIGAKPVNTSAPVLREMEQDAKRNYSLCRLFRSFLPGEGAKVDIGFENEVSQAIRSAGHRTHRGDFTIPSEALGIGVREHDGKRVMQATTPSSGGYTVATDLMGELIEKLDNFMIVGQLGVRRLSGLVGNVNIARQTGGATAYWVAENVSLTDSETTFDMLALTPHTVGATSPISKQLIAQSSFDAEAEVRTDLQLRLAIAQDLAFFQGTGANGQPLGLFNQTQSTTADTPLAATVTKTTFSAATTWAMTRTIVSNILASNVPTSNVSFVISPATWAKWSTKSADSGSGVFLWTGRADDGSVGGYPGKVSQHLPSNYAACGAWNNAYWAQWGGLDIVVDPYALKKTQALEVTVYDMVDFAFRHLEAFCVSTDSGAQ